MKFKDADLFGIPVVVVVGERNLRDGVVEFRVSDKNVKETIPADQALSRVMTEICW